MISEIEKKMVGALRRKSRVVLKNGDVLEGNVCGYETSDENDCDCSSIDVWLSSDDWVTCLEKDIDDIEIVQ